MIESPSELDAIVQRIVERFSRDSFGSCARGDARPDSDIGRLVLFSEVDDPNKRAAQLYASLAGFARPMDIVVFHDLPFRAIPQRSEHGVLAGFA